MPTLVPVEETSTGSGANAVAVSDDELMPTFVPVEELFKGRHFDQEIVSCAFDGISAIS